MEIIDAINGTAQIIDEERKRPTINYTDIANDWVNRVKEMTPGEIDSWSAITSLPRTNLYTLRKESPRTVTETPQIYSFTSSNFDLLLAIYNQVTPAHRSHLINYVLRHIESGETYAPINQNYSFPAMDGHVSEFPLVAEFCIRTGNTEPFFEVTAKPQMPTLAMAIMMMQLEETIALNFNLFSNEQLLKIPDWLAPLREVAYRQTHFASGTRGGQMVENPHYKPGNERVARQIVKSIDGISIECQQARYWYLKGALQQTVNLEIESDKVKVESYLIKLGFNEQMVKSLNAAEIEYKSSANPFELKNCLGHLRSFLEHLHRETTRSIAATAGDSTVDKWGDATKYLRQKDILTKQQEDFSTALFTLMSDESVHPLVAQQEQARLLRNVVIEYGVMFLSVLDKKGIKL